MGTLSGKIAVVFGASGDIGGEISLGLRGEGAFVIPCGRNLKRLRAISSELAKNGNGLDVILRAVDVTDEGSVKKFLKDIAGKYGRIDVMVFASGIYLNKPSEKTTTNEWDKVMNVNLRGAFITMRETGKIMLKQGKGSIISIGSLGSSVAMSNTIAYSASKAGLVSITKSFASEWAERGVRVNCVIPGVFPTRLNAKALAMKGRKENILKGIPMHRLGKLSELSGAVNYLASGESSYVTGISLPVDGGFLSFSGY